MKRFLIIAVSLIATLSTSAFASTSCKNGAAAAALQQVIAEVSADGRSFSNLKFQADVPNSTGAKKLKNGDVLESYNVLIYVFDGTNIIDGIEFPAKLSVKVIMRDVGAAMCKVEKTEAALGDDF